MSLEEVQEIISQIDEALKLVAEIRELDSCDNCADIGCVYRPMLGESPRYNCPLWKSAEVNEENVKTIKEILDLAGAEITKKLDAKRWMSTNDIYSIINKHLGTNYVGSTDTGILMDSGFTDSNNGVKAVGVNCGED